jgi:hypothetical protein
MRESLERLRIINKIRLTITPPYRRRSMTADGVKLALSNLGDIGHDRQR